MVEGQMEIGAFAAGHSSLQPSPPVPASIKEILLPLFLQVGASDTLRADSLGFWRSGEDRFWLPRFVFQRTQVVKSRIKVGIFAGIHGDEPEGVHAIVQFIRLLEARPELATGYYLSFYPICNPTGFEDNTRHTRSGKDLNREFWQDSAQPEIRILQAELVSRSFQGLISLHTDDTSTGFYGFARGATLTKHLIEPALQAAEKLLPRDARSVIDGFKARNGVIFDVYEGVLSAPPKIRPRPFEIILETPSAPPAYLKECALVLTLKSILLEYRKFIAFASNI